MTTDVEIRVVQEIIGYKFHTSKLLALAFQAPGYDDCNHDGHRRLAQLGGSVLQTVLLNKAFKDGASQSKVRPRGDALGI